MGKIIPYIMENKKCSKPPSRYILYYLKWQGIVSNTFQYADDHGQDSAGDSSIHPGGFKPPASIPQRLPSNHLVPSGKLT